MTQLQDVADHLAILNVEGEYARTWHAKDAAAWAALFTEDGSYEHLPAGDLPGGKYEGREQLEAFCRGMDQAGNKVLHLLHVPSLTIEGDQARSWIPFEVSGILQTPTLSVLTGVYHVVYSRTEDGWRIHSRTSEAMSHASSTFYGVTRGPLGP